jgi:CheY-like chemotaxis protein
VTPGRCLDGCPQRPALLVRIRREHGRGRLVAPFPADMLLSRYMMSHLFVFEPKPDFVPKILPLWEHHFVVHEVDSFEAMETALLSLDSGSAVILFNWDKWANPLVYLQKIRVWHRLIPIVIVSARMSYLTCLEALREQVYACLPRPLNLSTVEALLDHVFDNYDMLSLRNMYYLSIRKRKFVFNKTLRYQEFQILARHLATRDAYVYPSVSESVFALPLPLLLIVDTDTNTRNEIASFTDRYAVVIAETAEDALVLAAKHPEISLVLIDVALPGADEKIFLEALSAALPKAATLVWTASQRKDVAVMCFQVGVFEYMSKSDSAVSLASTLDTLLQMKWEMDAGGDIALYTRQFLFAAHCRYAFQQEKPVFWSDWHLFFKRTFPEHAAQTATDTPIPYGVFEQLGLEGLSLLTPDPDAYPDIFGTH